MNSEKKNSMQREIFPGFSPFAFFRRLFSRRGIKRILIVLAWIVTIIALLYGEEHWRGRRAWTKYRQEMEARGDQFDFAAFIPKEIPDTQNFAAIPFIKSWFVIATNAEQQKIRDNPWQDTFAQAAPLVFEGKFDPGRRHFLDLTAWAAAFDEVQSGKTNSPSEPAADAGYSAGPPPPGNSPPRIETADRDPAARVQAAPAVLEGMKSSAPALVQLQAAVARSSSHYPVFYNLDNPWAILLPHLHEVKAACSRLEMRACAELAAGKSAEAVEDVKLMLRLAESLKDEPILVSYLVRMACLQLAAHVIWEGLAEQRWSDEQLGSLQERLASIDLISDLTQPLKAERAAGVLTADLIARGKCSLNDLMDLGKDPPPPGGGVGRFISRAIPRGWLYLEQLNYCQLFSMLTEGTYDGSKQLVSLSKVEANNHELEHVFSGGSGGRAGRAFFQHRVLSELLLPALGNVVRKTAQSQTVVNQAVIGCALERYRLANGRLPDKLEDLSPRFLSHVPHDVINRQSYKYERDEDGKISLISAGADPQVSGTGTGKGVFDYKHGVWVWKQ